jgi:two-component system chemotaxis sensor kinase CheA
MEQLLEQVRKVVLQIVEVEADDLPGLAELHSGLERIREQIGQIESLRADQQEMIHTATSAAGDLIEKIILQETEDAAETFKIVGATCESLQNLLEQISQGNSGSEVEFPAELDLGPNDQNAESKPTESETPNIFLPDNVDEAIFREFLSSQPDVLANLEAAVLTAEQDPTEENRNAIKGILHNLKGETGLMGLQEVSGFCHETESMLIEAGDDFPAEKLFAAKDWLQKAFAQLSGEDTGGNANESDQTTQKKEAAAKSAKANNQEAADPANEPITIAGDDVPLVMDFINESNEHLETAEGDMLTIEENPEDDDAVNSIFRAFHTIKGVAGFLNLKLIVALAHATENLLDLARKGKLTLTGASIDVVFKSTDAIKNMLTVLQEAVENQQPFSAPDPSTLIERIEACASGESPPARLGEQLIEQGATDRATVREALQEQRSESPDKKLGEILVEKKGVDPAQIEEALGKQAESAKTGPPAAGKKIHGESTIKITTTRLDSLINMVGELMVSQSMVSQDLTDYVSSNQRLERNSRQLNKITRDLQELSMSMRMVPVQGVFQKMARLVRDLSRKAGKEIDFQMEGANTEVDRNVVETIADPLVHMVRNSVDHGVETPEQREKTGKSRTGKIKLSAYHQGGNIVIEIADDGKGLDRDRILEKAIKNGLVKEGQGLSDQEIYRLIFHAGLSTAQKVTDISGRGVGMDVVRKNVESLRGRVDIDSTPGRGSVFSIRLPLTLAVIDGQIVTVANEKYIIPLLSVERSLRPNPEQLSSVYGGKGEAIMIHGDLLPLVRLYELFDIEPRTTDPCQGLVVIVTDGEKRCCLLVDDLAGQQQVVIKNLGSYLGSIAGVSGGAIMGDGNVALIMDVPGLIQLAQHTEAEQVVSG